MLLGWPTFPVPRAPQAESPRDIAGSALALPRMGTTREATRVAAVAAALLLSTALVAAAPSSASAPGDEGTPVSLERPGGWNRAEILYIDSVSDLDEIVLTLPAEGREVTIGISAGSSGDLPSDLRGEVLATLEDVIGSGEGSSSRSEDAVDASLLKAALREFESREFTAVRVTLRPGAVVPRGYEEFVVASVDQESQSASAQSSCTGDWWPTSISIQAQPSSVAGHRYADLKFSWSTSRLNNLKCFGNVTFEPDFVTYNYDDKHYYGSSIAAWLTTMPYGYKDTPFSDSSDERVYTIGSADATALASNTTYRVYFRTVNGNTVKDTAKINFQRGHRFPSWCYSTWCIFADDTERVPASGWFSIPVWNQTYYP